MSRANSTAVKSTSVNSRSAESDPARTDGDQSTARLAAARLVGESFPRSSRYRLTRCIARGGMGSVYAGVQVGAAGFERPVAIKRTHAHLLENPDFRQTILQEARNASAVRHPNVVSIDDVEEVDGELLLVMDFIDGGSLSQLIASGKRLPIGVVLSIILDACAGLSAIHTTKDRHGKPLGLIHRDVSPQNILVGLDGAARITDFGIAKGVADPTRTAKSARRGKFGYMAPEYLLTSTSTTSSDIFALGAVLWEALAGRRLFQGETNLDSIRLTAAAEVPSLRALNPQVSPALEAVVRRALARSPGDRLRSTAELGHELEAATQGLVATRAEVAEWVLGSTPARPSINPTVHVETVSVSDVELIDDSAVHSVLRLVPPSEAASRSAPMATTSPRIHPAFRLEATLEKLSPPAAPRVEAPKPVRQPAPRRRSTARLAGMIAVVVLVVTSTAALAYAGLSRDGAAANHERPAQTERAQ